ncbi:sugar phosphate isomerase/epimerase family protein [Mediterraneibacter faecis]|uniref:sugar phosphate isomerase/epimerase family protein n=1 Tax=Mediterraneibacter faecis TaxID=592978 RepID=UPI003F9DB096
MKLINREQIAGMNIHYLFYSLDYFLDKQAELGFKTIELWGGSPHFYLDSMGYQDAKVVRKKIESRGLQVKVFTPENVMYQYQMAAQTPELFEKSFQYFKNGLQVASELGCKIMQTNSGWGYWNEDREEAWKRSREMISKLADEAGRLGICLAMESLRPQESQLVVTLKDAKRMYDEVNSPNLKILIDTTAMSVQGETIDDWFDVFGDEVIHTHFIDSNPYGHLAWGFGNRSLQEYLEALNRHNYQGCLGQELTEFDYYENPGEIDRKNMAAFEPFIR